MIRFGVVGCGTIHQVHCDAIRQIEGARLGAVCDNVPERAREAGEHYGVPHFTDVRPMLRHVDAVSICTPSGLHAQIGVRCAKAGKHVITEKPIEVTLPAAERLVTSCREAGVKLGCISQHRFANDIRALEEAARTGGLGRLFLGDAYVKWYRTQEYYDSGEWRGTWKLDGGCLMNQGVHYIDMIQWVMGGVSAVRAEMRTATHEMEAEDVAAALVNYKNGAIGVIQSSTSCYPGFTERVEVHGEHGTVMIDGDRAVRWDVDPNVPGLARREAAAGPQGSGAADPTAIFGDQHRLQIEDFVQAVIDDREPFVTGEMALAPLRVVLGIYKSARRGGARVAL
jgi:UDP-N-acetyl-2-amino-2-deoxyglucuronate dehydrogenase